jgi:hypothetical protein
LRLAPIAVALGVVAFLQHRYGTHSVELIFSIPSVVDDHSGLDVRITHPDGRLVLRLEENVRASTGHTVVVPARLPRGRFHVDARLQRSGTALRAEVTYDGEDELEVPLSAK